MHRDEKKQPVLDRALLNKVALRSPDGLLAFGFGSGLSPFAPGTMGTLIAIPFAFALKGLEAPAFWVALFLLFWLGVYVCDRVSQKLGVHDHGGIVWDEFVGFWITMAFLPVSYVTLLLGFILFRLFDIFKPWPISWLDKHVGGGLGIMIDDVVAGLAAAGCIVFMQSQQLV